jgi:hypothetical protein
MRTRHIWILLIGTCAAYPYSCQAPPAPIDDDIPPTYVTIIRPAAGPVTDTVTVVAYAEDNAGTPTVTWRVNGVKLPDADSTRPYEHFWDTSLSEPGTYEWVVVARDKAGNKTESAPVVYTVNP